MKKHLLAILKFVSNRLSRLSPEIIAFVSVVLLGAFLCFIAWLPISYFWKAIAIFILLLASFVSWKVFCNRYWEKIAKKRSITLLNFLGFSLVTKGISGLSFDLPELSKYFLQEWDDKEKILYLLLAAFLGGNSLVNLVLVILGLGVLIIVLFKLDQSYISLNEPVINQDWIDITDTYDSDLPPIVDFWVGREAEKSLVLDSSYAVVAVTGIGGQGKSALAAKSVEDFRQDNPGAFWDWRDCREESNRFRTHLINVLSRISINQIRPETALDADMSWLSKRFFQICENINGLLVLDNVDQYVNTETSLYIDEVSIFIEEALRVSSKFRIVLTCRPRISYPSVRFREVYLRGLNIVESEDLFSKRLQGGVSGEIMKMVPEFYRLCEGHPLWLNLISSQIERKPNTARTILDELRKGQMDERASAMLRAIWAALGKNERAVLRCMAEFPRAMESEHISVYAIGHCTNRNRFERSFKALRKISLITEKSSDISHESRFELHPLVKSFVKAEYATRDHRHEVIGTLIVCCDQLIIQLSTQDPIRRLEQLTTKIELEFNSKQLQNAIETLYGASDELITSGLQEEVIRLSLPIFQEAFQSLKGPIWETKQLHSLVHQVVKLLVNLGRIPDCENVLTQYTRVVTSGTVYEIGLCDLNCYVKWFLGDHETAIKYGIQGVTMKNESNIDTHFDSKHNLALARRDSGQVDLALKHFLMGYSIEDVTNLNEVIPNKDSSFYGNIGRCLALMQETQKALICFSRSFDMLERENTTNTQINLGYCMLWIGDALMALNIEDYAYLFYAQCLSIWRKSAPHRVEDVLTKMGLIKDKCISEEDLDHEYLCREWVHAFLRGEMLESYEVKVSNQNDESKD